jgi:hypothetical protein
MGMGEFNCRTQDEQKICYQKDGMMPCFDQSPWSDQQEIDPLYPKENIQETESSNLKEDNLSANLHRYPIQWHGHNRDDQQQALKERGTGTWQDLPNHRYGFVRSQVHATIMDRINTKSHTNTPGKGTSYPCPAVH